MAFAKEAAGSYTVRLDNNPKNCNNVAISPSGDNFIEFTITIINPCETTTMNTIAFSSLAET